MKIADLKAGGDLAKKRDELTERLEGYRGNRRRSVVDTVKGEFTKYFEAEGFSVSDRGDEQVAEYERATVTLRLPSPASDPVGGFAKFTLTEEIRGNGKSEHVITANLKLPPRNPGSATAQKTEVEKLQAQIDDLQQILAAYPTAGTEYHFIQNPGRANVQVGKHPVESFTDALRQLFS